MANIFSYDVASFLHNYQLTAFVIFFSLFLSHTGCTLVFAIAYRLSHSLRSCSPVKLNSASYYLIT